MSDNAKVSTLHKQLRNVRHETGTNISTRTPYEYFTVWELICKVSPPYSFAAPKERCLPSPMCSISVGIYERSVLKT